MVLRYQFQPKYKISSHQHFTKIILKLNLNPCSILYPLVVKKYISSKLKKNYGYISTLPVPEFSWVTPSRLLLVHGHYICTPTIICTCHQTGFILKILYKKLCVSISYQVRPNNHFLREAENTQPSSFQCAIKNISRICHHVFSLKYPKSWKLNN